MTGPPASARAAGGWWTREPAKRHARRAFGVAIGPTNFAAVRSKQVTPARQTPAIRDVLLVRPFLPRLTCRRVLGDYLSRPAVPRPPVYSLRPRARCLDRDQLALRLRARPESARGRHARARRDVQLSGGEPDELEQLEAGPAPERLVVAGGDGTVAQIAAPAGRIDVPLGVIAVSPRTTSSARPSVPLEPVDAAVLGAHGYRRLRKLDLGRLAVDPFSPPSPLNHDPATTPRTMRKIKSNFFISLDGVVESPDQWHFPYFNDEMGASLGVGFEGNEAILMGRVVYDEWAACWPEHADERLRRDQRDQEDVVSKSRRPRRMGLGGRQRRHHDVGQRHHGALAAARRACSTSSTCSCTRSRSAQARAPVPPSRASRSAAHALPRSRRAC